MTLRELLDTTDPGWCVVWVKGTPGAAMIRPPFAIPGDAIASYLLDFPQSNGTTLYVAEYAGWVRRYVVTPNGAVGGNLDVPHTAALRQGYKPRKKV